MVVEQKHSPRETFSKLRQINPAYYTGEISENFIFHDSVIKYRVHKPQ